MKKAKSRKAAMIEFLRSNIGLVVSVEEIQDYVAQTTSKTLTIGSLHVYIAILRNAGYKLKTVRGAGYMLEEAPAEPQVTKMVACRETSPGPEEHKATSKAHNEEPTEIQIEEQFNETFPR